MKSDRQPPEEMIAACRHGDRQAFRRLFDAYQSRVYSMALHFFHGDEATAEDVTQEVFLRLFARIGQFRRESEFSTWLHRIVVNVCVDEQRKRRRWVFLGASEMPVNDRSPAGDVDLLVQIETRTAVQAALADLTPELRATVLLRYFEGLSYEEMADALRCSKGTVASRLHRCHKILARKLAPLRDELLSGD